MPRPSLVQRHRGALLALLILAGVLAGVAAMFARKTLQPAIVSVRPVEIELAANDVVLAKRQAKQPGVSLTGTLNPVVQVRVNAPFEGRVADVAVRPGDKVAAGERLARFDETDLHARFQERSAAVASAEEQLRVAERTRTSNQALLSQNFISKNAYDNTLGGYAERRAALDAQLAQLAIIKRAMRDAQVTAPFPGVVATRNVEPGQWVEPNRNLFTLVDLRRLEIEASIPSQKIALVRVGQRVTFKAEGFGDEPFEGRLTRISPTTQSGTRSLLVYVALENPGERLRAGLFVSGEIAVGQPQNIVLLPVTAVQRSKQGFGVWVVEGSRLHWRPVETALESSEEVRVLKGLEGGERVVATLIKGATEGLAVRVSPL